jgi:transposase
VQIRFFKEKDLKARKNNRQLSQEYESKGLDLPPGKRKRRIDNELRLKRLMEINRDLNTAYVLLEQFRLAYQVDDKDELQQGMELWCSVARKSKVPELIRFAQTIERHMEGITNHAKHPISSGKLEGVNNLAKVIKRNAYGFVDDEYFFLKLKQASRRPYYKPKSPRFLH